MNLFFFKETSVIGQRIGIVCNLDSEKEIFGDEVISYTIAEVQMRKQSGLLLNHFM